MKTHLTTAILLLVLIFSLAGNAQAIAPNAIEQPALVYVEIGSSDDLSRFSNTHLAMYALLANGLVTGADRLGQQGLHDAGLSFQVIDPLPDSGAYYLAGSRPSRLTPDFNMFGQVLLHTADGVFLRMDPSRAAALSQAGAELQAISLTPKLVPFAHEEDVFPQQVEPDPVIQSMIDQVTETQVYTYDKELAGELPVYVDGDWYTITTRSTGSGTPIQKTTHYVGQHMANLGLNVDYHVWDDDTNPDVVGEIQGMVNPDDIYIIGAHIDDVGGTKGADDNASGSVATLLAADILSQYQWGCTLRFAFWTGEEQGLYGSYAYAQEAASQGQNILGYLNLDMIAWNTLASPPGIDLIYNSGMPATHDLAQLFADVVAAYNINLIPQLGTSLGGGSDHSSFWDFGYNSILAIEDQSDFNPYYHGPGDTPAHTDPAFFTNFVKASLATYAHMSNCLISTGVGQLDGHATAAGNGSPIEAAKVTASDALGHELHAYTDETGYYTRTLLTGTYTVTASAYSFLPSTVSGVTITTDTLTTQDFSLVAAPTHVVSGTVSEAVSGSPLLAEVSFDGAPTVVWTDPATGFYQAELPENSYMMHVRSALHQPQERSILLDQDQTQDFALQPLPCVLLVDDDRDDPDQQIKYAAALDSLGVDYDLWDTSLSGDPSLDDISGYRKILWYTGYPYNDTFNADNESAVGSYLEYGGNFFLSSQDYLYEMGVTPFGQDYLHIQGFDSDIGQTTVTGQNVFSGLGPYPLSYPFTNYSDVVNPDGQSVLAFSGNMGNAAISYDGGNFKTVFLGYPFEAISQAAGRQAVMGQTLDFFGECQLQYGALDGHVMDASMLPLQGVNVSAAPGMQTITDASGYYSMTLPVGTYTVTVSLEGYIPLAQTAVIHTGEVTTLDFILQPACEAITSLDFTWLPIDPHAGDLVTFTAGASGSEPLDFQWDFGDTFTGTGATATHAYQNAGVYTVGISASNACSNEIASKDLAVQQTGWRLYLPLLFR